MAILNNVAGGFSNPPVSSNTNNKPVNKWFAFFAGIILIASVVTLVVFAMENLSLSRDHMQLIKDKDIPAGAYFYTDVQQFRDAQNHILDSRNYTPILSEEVVQNVKGFE